MKASQLLVFALGSVGGCQVVAGLTERSEGANTGGRDVSPGGMNASNSGGKVVGVGGSTASMLGLGGSGGTTSGPSGGRSATGGVSSETSGGASAGATSGGIGEAGAGGEAGESTGGRASASGGTAGATSGGKSTGGNAFGGSTSAAGGAGGHSGGGGAGATGGSSGGNAAGGSLATGGSTGGSTAGGSIATGGSTGGSAAGGSIATGGSTGGLSSGGGGGSGGTAGSCNGAGQGARGPTLVNIPGAKAFVIGDTDFADASPHAVDFSAFQIDETEVTVAQFQACVTAGCCSAPQTGGRCNWGVAQRDDHPINCVDWDQATSFCAWAGKRLPTEAEWEYVARRPDGRDYPWGGSAPIFGTGQQLCWSQGGGTCPVKKYPGGGSADGVADLAGNVWEWTVTQYCGNYLSSVCLSDNREVRGGSFIDTDDVVVRGAYRYLNGMPPSSRFENNGFRCAR